MRFLIPLLLATAASAAPLKTTVVSIHEPQLRVARLDSGKTPNARYASPLDAVVPGVPLVVLLRGTAMNPPAIVKVTSADLTGNVLTLAVQRRSLSGPHTCTMCLLPEVPLVEVEVGALAAGEYRVVVKLTDQFYDDQNQPQNTTKTTTSQDGFSFFVHSPVRVAPAP